MVSHLTKLVHMVSDKLCQITIKSLITTKNSAGVMNSLPSPIKKCLLTPNLNQPSQYITIYQQFFLPFPKPINNVKMIDEHVN